VPFSLLLNVRRMQRAADTAEKNQCSQQILLTYRGLGLRRIPFRPLALLVAIPGRFISFSITSHRVEH
jgi:hypothetical protein